MHHRAKLIAVSLLATILILPAMIVFIYSLFSISAVNCYTPYHSLLSAGSIPNVYANRSNPEQMASGSNQLDPTSYFGLTNVDVPYTIVSGAKQRGLLAEYELPTVYKTRLALVIWNGSDAITYLSNGTGPQEVYSHSTYIGEYKRLSKWNEGSYTIIEETVARMYIAPLPGNYNNPIVIAAQNIAILNIFGQLIGNITAKALFSYIPGGQVTYVSADGSEAYAYHGYRCVSNVEVEGAESTIAFIQNNAIGAINFGIIATNWWSVWPGMALNSLTGLLTFNDEPYWNIGTSPS